MNKVDEYKDNFLVQILGKVQNKIDDRFKDEITGVTHRTTHEEFLLGISDDIESIISEFEIDFIETFLRTLETEANKEKSPLSGYAKNVCNWIKY